MFVIAALTWEFSPFMRPIIGHVFCVFRSSGDCVREIAQFQKKILFLKSIDPELSFDMLCYEVSIQIGTCGSKNTRPVNLKKSKKR